MERRVAIDAAVASFRDYLMQAGQLDRDGDLVVAVRDGLPRLHWPQEHGGYVALASLAESLLHAGSDRLVTVMFGGGRVKWFKVRQPDPEYPDYDEHRCRVIQCSGPDERR